MSYLLPDQIHHTTSDQLILDRKTRSVFAAKFFSDTCQ